MPRHLFFVLLMSSITVLAAPALAQEEMKEVRQSLYEQHNELGRFIDQTYYDLGARLDLIHFDLQEAHRQGRDVPEELMARVEQLDEQMRTEWIRLDAQRQRIFDLIDRWPAIAKPDQVEVRHWMGKLHDSAETMRTQFEPKIDQIQADAQPFVEGPVWEQRDKPVDSWENQWIRAVSMHFTWGNIKWEHVVKSTASLNPNMNMMFVYNEKKLPGFFELADPLMVPTVRFALEDMKAQKFYRSREGHLEQARKLLEPLESHRAALGLGVDEPHIRDQVIQYESVREAFDRYLQERKPELADAGIEIPQDWAAALAAMEKNLSAEDRKALAQRDVFVNSNAVFKPRSVEDYPLWMEWQQFKIRYMGEHYGWLYQQLAERDNLLMVSIQGLQINHPEWVSFVQMGRNLPFISTDIYDSSAPREPMSMRLLQNTNPDGRVMFIAGSAFTGNTPERFERSMVSALAHADGLMEWALLYYDKYRNPAHFWNYSARNTHRGYRMRNEWWAPWTWPLMKRIYGKAEAASPHLYGTDSVAQTAVLMSERTTIAEVAQFSNKRSRPYAHNVVALWSDLMSQGRPIDAAYIESFADNPELTERLKVAVVPDARALTAEDIAQLRKWVEQGGRLIVMGATSTDDAWARPQQQFAMQDMLGASYVGNHTGASTFQWNDIEMSYAADEPYVRVTPQSAEVLASWDNGDPAVLRNSVGDGTVYLLTWRRAAPSVLMNTYGMGQGRYGDDALFGGDWDGQDEVIWRLAEEADLDKPLELATSIPDLEFQVSRKESTVVAQFVDWRNNREVADAAVRVNLPGRWEVSYPGSSTPRQQVAQGDTLQVPAFRIHQLIVFRPISQE